MYGSLLTIFLSCGGAVYALYRPYVGFLIYVCLGLLGPEDLWSHGLPAWSYSRIVGIGMLLGWMIHGFGNWKLGRATAIVSCLIAFGLWSCLTAVAAAEPEKTWEYLEGLAKVILPFLVGITMLESKAQLKQLAWVIVATEGFVAYELNMHYLAGWTESIKLDSEEWIITASPYLW